MNEHDIKKFIKLLKKYNSGDYAFDDLQELYRYSSEFDLHVRDVLSTWDDQYE